MSTTTSSTAAIIDLPQPKVLEQLDYQALLAERKARLRELAEPYYQQQGKLEQFEQLKQTLELPSEPLVKLLEESCYRELLLRQRVNDAAQAVMLPLAVDSDLDNLGAMYGVSRNTTEGDESYRQRLLLAPKSLSTAGSKAAYKFHALSAGNTSNSIEINTINESKLQVSYYYDEANTKLVKDAIVNSPSPCVVDISLLGFDEYGELSPSAIEQVSNYVSGDTVRPLGDLVNVSAAQIIKYQWQITLHLSAELENTVQTELLLTNVQQRLIEFVKDHHYLGKSIRYSTLLGAISPLIDGWVSLGLKQPSEPSFTQQDIVLSNIQAPYLDLSSATAQNTWDEKLEYVVSQSIEVLFDG